MLALAGCATTGDAGAGDGGENGQCDAAAGQRFVGSKASADVGQQLLRATGAKQLRWGPPNSAMTMDFRQDRLTVSYDAAMTIDRVSCG
ncbi:peptidase inhibitor I78 [Altererythrobacter xixiisoli]|uniref:Peptidase inhibitor I78 n=2 Tax=Croceibacterium xixiisoli TaxID=1476466 RepID=A0A6I4TVF0_9SPHN|nr:peptidase inhibitor I78 [Croceibacterium xixiisoli]